MFPVFIPFEMASTSNTTLTPANIPARPKDEKETVAQYFEYFEVLSTINGWDDERAARTLVVIQPPGTMLKNLLDQQTANVKKSLKAIKKLEDSEVQLREKMVLDLMSMRRKNNQSMDEYAGKITHLVHQLYPGMAARYKGILAKDVFFAGLDNFLRIALIFGRK